jgi:threonine/homoserine/homoserine lactone efflux protein
MLAIIVLILLAIASLAVLSVTAHILFSPLFLVAIAVLAWLTFRRSRSRR